MNAGVEQWLDESLRDADSDQRRVRIQAGHDPSGLTGTPTDGRQALITSIAGRIF